MFRYFNHKLGEKFWYRKSDWFIFICTGTHNDMPVFKKFCNIIIHEQYAFTIGSSVNRIYFSEHFHAYCIKEQNNEYDVICIDQLTYFKPFDKQYSILTARAYMCSYSFKKFC